ncbi:MAG: hypothetical protein QOJ13_2778 [Gaiellales bacterium]|jgi:phytoene dehydrogenase-like protein|nr:hypothetical protein [Gaiellales bacterium]
MTPTYDAIVVGGGHNGLVSAWYLAEAGMNVLVVERRRMVGGAAVTEELWPGYRVPTCSYICYLLQPRIIDEMALREYGLAIHPVERGMFAPFPDGRALVGGRRSPSITNQIGAISERDAEAYPRYLELRKRLAGLINRSLFEKAPTLVELVDSVRDTEDEALLERLLFGSVADLLDEYFESDQMKGWLAMAWDAGDVDAPGSLLSGSYTNLSDFLPSENYGLVSGGMGGITEAMARSCSARGVEIRTDATVEEILVEHNRATGVRLSTGETIFGDTVLVNADIKQTFLRLVDSRNLPEGFIDAVKRLKANTAYYKFHAVLDDLPDFSAFLGDNPDLANLAHTVICPSLDYYRQAWDDARRGRITRAPVLHLQIPTVIDRSLVSNGGHVMSIWALYAPVRPVGHGTDRWTDDLTHQAGEAVLEMLERFAPNIRTVIKDWVMFTPDIIEQRVGMTNGNIHHIDQVVGQMFANRPMPGWADYRMPIDGLYLCGADTHPGGEVTGVPGYNAAHKVIDDLGKPFPVGR